MRARDVLFFAGICLAAPAAAQDFLDGGTPAVARQANLTYELPCGGGSFIIAFDMRDVEDVRLSRLTLPQGLLPVAEFEQIQATVGKFFRLPLVEGTCGDVTVLRIYAELPAPKSSITKVVVTLLFKGSRLVSQSCSRMVDYMSCDMRD